MTTTTIIIILIIIIIIIIIIMNVIAPLIQEMQLKVLYNSEAIRDGV